MRGRDSFSAAEQAMRTLKLDREPGSCLGILEVDVYWWIDIYLFLRRAMRHVCVGESL
jgi:hypothetical protein